MPEPRDSRPEDPERGTPTAGGVEDAFPWAEPLDRQRPDAEMLAIEYKLREETDTRVPFAAVLDIAEKRWRFATPTHPAGASGTPTAGPEAFLLNAVRAVVGKVFRTGRFDASDLMIDARAGHLHVAGFASAADVRQPVCEELIRAYLGSLNASGPGDGIVVRPGDGGRIAVTFAPTATPTLPPTPVPDAGVLGLFPADMAATAEALRRALVARHRQVVATVQLVLDRLAGKHAADLDANRAVAAAVTALADDYGVALLYDGRPVGLRVIPVRRDPAGSFQVRLTGSGQQALKTSMGFPPLTAVSKATVNRPPTPGSDAANPPPTE